MNCAQSRPLLGDHLEGDLALSVRSDLDEHLNQCSACSRELHELRSTIGLLRSLPTPEPPRSLVANVMQELAAQRSRDRRPDARFRRVFDPRIAAPLAAGVVGFVLFATMDGGLDALMQGGNQPTDVPIEIARETGGVASPAPANPTATNRIADRIERRIWDDRPATLGVRVAASGRDDAARPARFRVEPRLTSTEQNLAIRLRSKQHSTGGFYGRVDPDPQYLDLDAHIDRAKTQPEAFLAEVETGDEADRRTLIAPFAARAARRGDAQVVAGQLRRTSHPQARSAAELFEQSWHRTRARSDQPTYSR